MATPSLSALTSDSELGPAALRSVEEVACFLRQRNWGQLPSEDGVWTSGIELYRHRHCSSLSGASASGALSTGIRELDALMCGGLRQGEWVEFFSPDIISPSASLCLRVVCSALSADPKCSALFVHTGAAPDLSLLDASVLDRVLTVQACDWLGLMEVLDSVGSDALEGQRRLRAVCVDCLSHVLAPLNSP